MKLKTKLLGLILVGVLAPSVSFALTPPTVGLSVPEMSDSSKSIIASFKNKKEVIVTPIFVPTVVDVSLSQSESTSGRFAVYNISTDRFEPYLYYSDTNIIKTPITIREDTGRVLRQMADRLGGTFESFPGSIDGTIQETTFTIRSSTNESISATGIRFDFGSFVSYPLTIRVVAFPGQGITVGEPFAVISKTRFTGESIRFPKMSAESFEVTLTHTQPLQIREVSLIEEDADVSSEHGIRFLAQQNNAYDLYYNSDRYEQISTGEMPNLSRDEDVVDISYSSGDTNRFFVESDFDNDGVPDKLDNCVRTANSDQLDINVNGRGDVCDDFDRDGIANAIDNCPDDPNRYQRDEDGDGIGDECDDEESRLTEANPWIPWAGMGIAVVVIVFLFASTLRKMRLEKSEEGWHEETDEKPEETD